MQGLELSRRFYFEAVRPILERCRRSLSDVVLFADRFADALRAATVDPAVREVDHRAASVDVVSDNTDVLCAPSLFRALTHLYDRT
jgi:hypothetical protein